MNTRTATRSISQRSTLTSLRQGSGVVRGDALGPQAPLPRSSTRTGTWQRTHYHGHSHYPYHHSPHYGSFYTPTWRVGVSVSLGFGLFHPYVYFGSHSIAILSGHAWHITPYHHGWFGYRRASHCYYFGWKRRHHHAFYYHGQYCRVSRPYWYGYARWYDWRPHRYGYVSLAYDSVYDDGYGDGYNRGYEDGAEDTSAYRDDRRRDKVATAPRPRVPDPQQDRERGDAGTEYRHQMDRGSQAFEAGDYRGATTAFKEAVILNPRDAEARYGLAMSAFAEGKYAFSAFALRRGVTLDPEGSNIDLEAAFKGPDRLAGYLRHLDAELERAPSDADLLLLRGFASLRTGDVRAAASMLDAVRQQSPHDEAAKILHEKAMEALEQE